MTEKTIFELSRPGRRGVRFPEPDVPQAELPKDFLRSDLPLPEMPENEVVRHFTKISQFNHAVDVPAIVRCMLSAAVVMPETHSNTSWAEPRISAVDKAKIEFSRRNRR